MEPENFTFRRIASQGCEIVGPNGICAWTVDAVLAAQIVSLLNRSAGDGEEGDAPAKGGIIGEIVEHPSP